MDGKTEYKQLIEAFNAIKIGLEKGQSKGSFTLQEATVLFRCIEILEGKMKQLEPVEVKKPE